jgi:hypothetical protein
MFELIDAADMKEGGKYFIKRFDSITTYVIGEMIFINYKKTPSDQYFATFKYPYSSGREYAHLMLKILYVYRYVTEEEYWTKVKEKYDATCLDIVLKRLVDESFQW